jgi:hypothetical protein
MLIRIKKNNGGLHNLSYTRNDGTSTWMRADDYLVQHDITHYAVETILQYRTAFNGMLNDGMDVKDFEDKEKRDRMNITAEAVYAENLANLFFTETVQGNFEPFNDVQQSAFISFGNQYEPVTLAQEQIQKIRTYLRQLLKQWHELSFGETFELTFNL